MNDLGVCIIMKESKILEFKSDTSNSFLKTVSAFSNYDGGQIIFGVDNSGKIIGLDNLEELCLSIENKINDSIKPQPNFTLSITDKEKTITLNVKPGNNKPYFYNSKAYKRNDTSTIEVDNLELKRLILEGENKSFEELASAEQELSFKILENELKAKMRITRIDQDILRTLDLYTDSSGFNNAAAILADKNDFCGIDIAKFGETISIFQKRLTLEHQSILKSYDEAVLMFKDYYQYEVVDGFRRRMIEMVTEKAFREALANAIVHRTWDVTSHIRISMFDDRIEIISIGGLPSGVSEESFLEGRFSVLRNPILANIFHRLDLIEKFGTGIRRIKESYAESKTKPRFTVFDNSITVVLPVIREDLGLTDDEMIIYKTLSKNIAKPISEIINDKAIVFGKSKVKELLKSMTRKNIVKLEGSGRGTKYRISD